MVDGIRAEIDAGRLEKAVAVRRMTVRWPHLAPPARVLERLRREAPTCARFALTVGAQTFVGASPERLIRRTGMQITTEAVAGSISDAAPDSVRRLLESDKECAEHAIVVREVRAALMPLCAHLSIDGPLPLRLRHLTHMRTRFAGRLDHPHHVLDLVARLHPTPAVGGTPQSAALTWLDAHELADRGFFGGPFGAFDGLGDGHFIVAIRAGLLQTDAAHLFAGAGIVRDRRPRPNGPKRAGNCAACWARSVRTDMGTACAEEAAQIQGEWARLLVGTLAAAGVSEMFISPGSRSTPLAWLALETPGLRCHSVVDERCAAFAALGVARAAGRPAVLLCTSGSAAANYFPAIVEAALAYLPMLVITADRPFEAQHSGAAQCMDQVKLYGNHVRRYFELGLPDAAPTALAGLRRAVTQAVAIAGYPVPGPVHLNVRLRKPLEPPRYGGDEDQPLTARVSALRRTLVTRHGSAQATPSDAVLREIVRALRSARAGVIVVGPLPAYDRSPALQIGALASALGFPIMAEATSQARFVLASHPLACPEFAWLFGAAGCRGRFAADLLLCLGAPPACSDLELWASESCAARYVLSDYAGPDPPGDARVIAYGDLGLSLMALRQALVADGHEPVGAQRAYAAALLERARRCRTVVAEELARAPAQGRDGITEGAAVACIGRALPAGTQWMLGNSLAVRNVDAYVWDAADPITWSQRGTNGIDGLVSGAVGGVLAEPRPTLLLLGDVSLLHDLGRPRTRSHGEFAARDRGHRQ